MPEHHEERQAPQQPANSFGNPSWRNPWVILASGALLIFILACVGVWTRVASTRFSIAGPGAKIAAFGGPLFARPGMQRTAAGPASSVINMSGPEITGVVTAVNGNQLTVAGNGTSSSVTINSSTQYTGASSAAVDDTVVATGTSSGSSFTATHVYVNP